MHTQTHIAFIVLLIFAFLYSYNIQLINSFSCFGFPFIMILYYLICYYLIILFNNINISNLFSSFIFIECIKFFRINFNNIFYES